MTICTNRQFLSNMLWRLLVFFILGGFIAICSCEPVKRKLLPKALEIIECIDNETNMCGTNETVKTSDLTSDRENQTRTSREFTFREEFLDDNNEIEGEKKIAFIFNKNKFVNLFTRQLIMNLSVSLLFFEAILYGKEKYYCKKNFD